MTAPSNPSLSEAPTRPLNQFAMLFALFDSQERRRGVFLLLLATGMAFVDVLGIASVLPFLAVLAQPEVTRENRILGWLYQQGGFTQIHDFLFVLGLAALLLILAASTCRGFGQYAILRFANMRRYSVSARLFDSYVSRPYWFFLDRNSADLVKRSLSDVDAIVDNCLTPAIQMFAYAVVVVLLLMLLFVVDAQVASVIVFAVCGIYGAIYLISRPMIVRAGHARNIANRERFAEANETFGGIKEIKLLGAERDRSRRFRDPSYRYAQHRAANDSISQVPRYLVEAVAFGGALATTLVLMRLRGDIGSVLPVLGLYAFAGYRLLPAVQQVYFGVARLRFGLPMVQSVLEDLHTEPALAEPRDVASLTLRHELELKQVGFTYRAAQVPALREVNATIKAHTAVGFIGKTGAGKSTAIDLILGLLEPTSGQILIDGSSLTSANRRGWQATVGYVPQTIFLGDTSIAKNIAFANSDRLDFAAVERAARLADIHEFIVGQLPNGYETVVGERGVRLSGGQRQRIGIARALYRNPSVIVFDEATSALDDETEATVMKAINSLRLDKTIIIVAHRLSTLQTCDKIFVFDRGSVQAEPPPTSPNVQTL